MTLRIGIGHGTVTAGVAAPEAPTSLAASVVSSTQINLTWTDNSGSETSFSVERTPYGTSSWAEIATPVANAESYNDTGLSSGTRYEYRVRALGAGGYSSYSNTADAQTTTELVDGPATLPTAEVDFAVPTAGVTITVGSSGKDYTTLQSAWNSITSRSDHTEIVIDAAYDPGSLVTGAQTNDDNYWVIIRSANSGSLPRHVRVGPSDKADMFQLTVPVGTRAVSCGSNTRRVRFIGMSIEQNGSSYTGRQCEITNETSSYIIIDRCLQLGSDTSRNCVRAWTLAGENIGVIDCHFAEIAHDSTDCQAVFAFNGAGPYTIVNCFLEASTENIMFGGANPASNALVPKDITISRCYLYKDDAWYGTSASVKNLFELKLGVRVLVEDCIMENHWLDGQETAINWKTVNQSGTAADGIVECGHVTMRYCRILDAPEPLKMTGLQEGLGTRMHDVSVHDCLFYDMGTRSTHGSGSNALLFSNMGGEVNLKNNTIIMEGGKMGAMVGSTSANVVIKDNIMHFGTYGFKGDGVADGYPTLNAYCDTYTWDYNSIYGTGSSPSLTDYGANDTAADDITGCGFENDASKDYRLSSGSILKGVGTAGADPGCDVATLNTRLTNVESGDFSSDPWDS